MEFWATEVKNGEIIKVTPGEDTILHISQANVGEVKTGKYNESIYLFVNVDGQKLVLGTLSLDSLPQLQFDLVFDREFELSHSWETGNVYFFGYKMYKGGDEDKGDESDSDSELSGLPLNLRNTGKPVTKEKEEKSADAQKAEKKVSMEKPVGDDLSDDDSIFDADTDMDEDEDNEDDSEDEDESEEDKLVKVEPEKKRASDTEPETPTKKKAKVIALEKTDGKKGSGVHVDTPHPSKKGGKTSGGGGSHVCKSCSRTFGSENALDSHTKAKHVGSK